MVERQAPHVIERQITERPQAVEPPATRPPAKVAAERVICTTIAGRPWEITIDLSEDPAVGDWVDVFDSQPAIEAVDAATPRRIGVRVSMAHPFMERFGGTTSWDIEPLLRLAVGIALAEITARQSGVRFAGEVWRRLNDFLRGPLGSTCAIFRQVEPRH